MMRRLNMYLAVVACATLVPGMALAQAAGPLKIGAVDFGRLIKESPQAEVTLKSLEEKFAPRQRDLLAKQNDLKERQAKLQKDSEVMGAEERRNAESRFREDERDLGRRLNEFQEDLNVARNEELGKLQRDLFTEVQGFARKNGYDLIVGEGVIYASQSVDLTGQILAEVQANFKNKAAGKP